MYMFTYLDFVLLPIYVILLNLAMRWYNRHYNKDKILASLFMKGFRLKLFFGIAFAFYSSFVPGDPGLYYSGGLDFKKIILDNAHNLHFITSSAKEFSDYYEANGFNPGNYGYITAASNLMAMKFVALFSTVTFNSYLSITMLFSTFSFLGLWYMFKVFYKMYPGLFKPIFLIFFMIPSALFWGSGVLKDTLCLGFLGFGFYNAYMVLFEKKYNFKLILGVLFCFYCLYTLKSYIALAFIPCFILWFFLKKIAAIKNVFLKIVCYVVPLFLLFLVLVFGDLDEVVAQNAAEAVVENMMTTQQNYIRTTPDDGALIDYGDISPTVGGILKTCPKALVATLFRPFLWEARKATAMIAALEGALLFCFTIFVFIKKGFFKSFAIIASDSTILFCFIFSIIFATAIGLNCFNLGTLVRYKIPCLPFYLLCFLLVLKKDRHSERPVIAVDPAIPAH